MRIIDEIENEIKLAEQNDDCARAIKLVREKETIRKEIESMWFDIPLSRKQKICQAEKDGLLDIRPCKVGDTVYARMYSLTRKKYVIVEGICAAIKIFREGNIHIESVINGVVMKMELGRQVFLTKPEAEKALEMEGLE